jgi:phenylalanyl-tRNA synthetase beta chain
MVLVAGLPAGVVGEIHPGVASGLDLPRRVGAFELDVGILAPYAGRARPLRDIPRFPPVRRDLAFVVADEVPAGTLRSVIDEAGGPLLARSTLFDVFRGGTIPAGRTSLAFALEFRAPDRTLTDEEVEPVVAAIVERARSELGAELRA